MIIPARSAFRLGKVARYGNAGRGSTTATCPLAISRLKGSGGIPEPFVKSLVVVKSWPAQV